MNKTRKRGLFGSLALNGVKNNSKLYVPYLLAAIGTIAVYYILYALRLDLDSVSMGGVSTLEMILGLGCYVIAIFGVLFMLYTNSFLISARTKEFGLYNILGMSKFHIARIVATEGIMTGGFAIIVGTIVGILFEKLVQVMLYKIVKAETDYSFHIWPEAMGKTALFFGIIYVILMLRSVIRVYRLKTVDLMKDDKVGEKVPKANWLIALAGIVLLVIAYAISIHTKDPISALKLFFFAVIMVIVATYFIFIAGSVTFCKLLQKNKNYYYSKKHFVSLSQMIYRMKRNGAGLASICVISTMILVMLASTTCMYYGKEDGLSTMYPNEVMAYVYRTINADPSCIDIIEKQSDEFFENAAKEAGLTIENKQTARSVTEVAAWEGEDFVTDSNIKPIALTADSGNTMWEVLFVTTDEYERLSGNTLSLADDEVFLVLYNGKMKFPSQIVFNRDKTYKIVNNEHPDKSFEKFSLIEASIVPVCAFICNEYPDFPKDNGTRETFTYGFDLKDATVAEKRAFYDNVWKAYYEKIGENDFVGEDVYYRLESREASKADFYEMYGGIFFLGIVLSAIFSVALVLMIYYKQISEGYEDGSRYNIMKKIGMTDKDIRKSVKSQMKSVFYMPVIMAAIHLGFAFPIIYRLLTIFGILNLKALITTAIVSTLVFGVIYTIVYNYTSNSYYKLVR